MALREFNTKIDQIEMYDGKMKIICLDGDILIGKCIGNCLGTDESGEDVDGVRFLTDDGREEDLIEDDIKSVEFLDSEPTQN
jgi:hypothetical protein